MSEPLRVAPGVFAWIGDIDEVTPANRGEVGNIGFLIGPSGSVVLNTGASYDHGKRIIDHARRLGAGKPVRLAVVTEPLQEFVMGAAAFAEAGIPVLAHTAAARLIKLRCETCLRNLKRLLGDDAMYGTTVLEPTRRVTGSQALPIGETGGRSLRLLDLGRAHAPGDLAVFDERSGVLFAGGVLSIGRVPDLRDADAGGWRRVLGRWQRGSPPGVTRIVPGYGPVGGLADLQKMQAYLDGLEAEVARRLREGRSLPETIDGTPWPPFAHWALYGVLHRRNVQQAYLRLEAEAFAR